MNSAKKNTSFNTIFVGGAMRTGTSLLQNTLCSTPSANDMMVECQHLTSQFRTFAEWRTKNERALTDFFDGLDDLNNFTRKQVVSLLGSIHQRQNAPRDLILKHPELTPFFPEVAELLPNAKFVIIVRDPRDVIASMLTVAEKQKKLGRGGNMVEAGRNMKRHAQIFLSFYRSLKSLMNANPNKVMMVKYETLVTNPHQIFPDLSTFSGLDFSNFNANAEWVYTRPRNKNKAFDTNIRGGSLSDTSVGKYKTVLSKEEIRSIENYTSGFMSAFKYQSEE